MKSNSDGPAKVLLFITVFFLLYELQPGFLSAIDPNGFYPGKAVAAESQNVSAFQAVKIKPLRVFSSKHAVIATGAGEEGDEKPAREAAQTSGPRVVPLRVTAIAPADGFENSRAIGINESGQVAGCFYNWNAGNQTSEDDRGFIWDKSNKAAVLSTLNGRSEAWGVNENGLLAGWSYNADSYQRAVWWDSSDNSITDIGALSNSEDPSLTGNESCAYDIADSGVMVGEAEIPTQEYGMYIHAFYYDGTIHDMGTLVTGYPQVQNGESACYDINEQGQAVGVAGKVVNEKWNYRAYIWDEVNGMQELSHDSAYSSRQWNAVAINDNGLIGGHVIAGDYESLPYYWESPSAAEPVALDMPAGFPYGEIYGINADGQMVGIMWDEAQADSTDHAFIFDMENGVRDLNDYISSSSAWVLEYAFDINDSGQIVGRGNLNGEFRGFLLDEVLSNPSLPLLLLDEEDGL